MTNRIEKREIVYNDLNKHFVVINDIKYGSDFALYKGGAYVQNIYLNMIHCCHTPNGNCLIFSESVDHEHAFALVFVKDESLILTDKEKIIISRICESVKKRGIIAYVDDHTKTIKYEELIRNKK
ncbi:hypothetical protein YYE_00180 [Plasmodium vinckei vinckei]|nr:hypothetical protein YYE_00180 [Plasmodium vinckei vinckei]